MLGFFLTTGLWGLGFRAGFEGLECKVNKCVGGPGEITTAPVGKVLNKGAILFVASSK